MKISILTAVRNRHATLADALDSLACQTHTDWENLVQDGGSSDGTLAILEQRPDSRRHVESARDGGIYDALNRAFARSCGEIIGLLHSDDFFAHAEVLAHVAARFEETGADVVYGDLDYVAAAQLRHESALHTMFVEILPNVIPPILVETTVRLGYAIFAVATLSFMGFGMQPPSPDWGLSISSNYGMIGGGFWWTVLFDALAIASLVIGVNLAADDVHGALND